MGAGSSSMIDNSREYSILDISFLLCIILFAKFISNFVNSYHLYNCQGPGGWPSELPINHMTQDHRNAIARVTDDSIVGIMKGYTADYLSEAQTLIVGQTNQAIHS